MLGVYREMITTAWCAVYSRLVMTNYADEFIPPALVFLHYNPRRTLVSMCILVRKRELPELPSSVIREWFTMRRARV